MSEELVDQAEPPVRRTGQDPHLTVPLYPRPLITAARGGADGGHAAASWRIWPTPRGRGHGCVCVSLGVCREGWAGTRRRHGWAAFTPIGIGQSPG